MKKIPLILFSMLIVVSSISITCFASGINVAPANTTGDVVIREDPEITKNTTQKSTNVTVPETDPITTNIYQYAENLKTTNVTTTQNSEAKSTTSTSKKFYMNATFVSDVPDTVEGDILISLYNKDTKETFEFILPKTNRYFLMTELPVGHYTYDKVNIPNNESGRFVAEYNPFVIGYSMNSIINFSVIDKEASTSAVETQSIVVNEITTDEVTETTVEADIIVQPTEEKNDFKGIVVPIVILIIVIGLFIFKKISKKNNDENEVDNTNQISPNRF